jgi:hypothetical protein
LYLLSKSSRKKEKGKTLFSLLFLSFSLCVFGLWKGKEKKRKEKRRKEKE